MLVLGGKFISIDDKAKPFTLETLSLIKEIFESGKIRPVIGKRYPLEQVSEAHSYVDKGHKLGNVIITMQH